MYQETEESRETTISKESFMVTHPGGHVFMDDRITAHWDDDGVRYRVFNETLIAAMSTLLLTDSPVRIRVQGRMRQNNAIGLKDMTVESWMTT
jgi:hypothetical protein